MMSAPGDRLESWKEIAAYVSRGVRTVRRWEADEGLPVHRHLHHTQGTVFAFKSEIDAWRASASRAATPREPVARRAAGDGHLQVRQERWRWRKDAIDHAVRLLRNGIETAGDDPNLHAALGVACLQYREAGIDVSEAPLVEAERCAGRVFVLEGASAHALQLRGWIHYARGRIHTAVVDLKASLAADPESADTMLLLANCYLLAGQAAHARPLITRVLAIDPLTPLTRCMPAWADALEGRWEAAIEPYGKMFAMDPDNPMARLFYVWVLAANGRLAEAREIAGGLTADVRETVPGRLCAIMAAAAGGDPRRVLANITPEVERAGQATDVFSRLLAQACAMAGLREPALLWLERAVARGFINYPFLAHHDPFFAGLRGDAAYRDLLARVQAQWRQWEG